MDKVIPLVKSLTLLAFLALTMTLYSCGSDSEAAPESGISTVQPVTVGDFNGADTVDEIDYRKATIRWTSHNEAVSYTVFWVNAGVLTFKAHVTGKNKNKYVLKNLEPDTEYSVIVRAMDASGAFDTNTNVETFTTTAYGAHTNDTSLDFDGTKSVELADSNKLVKKKYSISFWFKTDTLNSDSRVINLQKQGGGSSINIGLDNSGVKVGYRDETDTYKSQGFALAYDDAVWRHVVLTYNNAKYRLYVDGIKQLEIADTNIGHGSAKAYIGSFQHTQKFYDGLLDEVSLWSRVLNQAEIDELYNMGQTTELRIHSRWKNLVSWWRFETSLGDDQSIVKDIQEKWDAIPQGHLLVDYVTDIP
jgi:hypothetical protein